jgi:hypothetical protein
LQNHKRRRKRKKENEVAIHLKIVPPNAIVDYEGWNFFFPKGMYDAKLFALIQIIWLKRNKFTYVAKKLLSLVVLAEQRVWVNWVGVIFSISPIPEPSEACMNLYYKLHDLSALAKIRAS